MTKPEPIGMKLCGIVLDLDPEDVAPDRWTNGRNVMFRNMETWRVPGEAPFAPDQLFDADYIHFVDMGFEEYWIYVSDEGVGATDGVSHWDITPDGWGAIASKNLIYTLGDLNTIPFVNHPERGPYYWSGDVSQNMEPLPDWPDNWSCGAMRAHKNYLMALAIDTGSGLAEGQVSWSSSADPGNMPDWWHPAPDNDAGDVTFSSPSGPILDGISVRDQFFVMKSNATFVLQYVGGQFVFQARDVFPSTGIMSAGAVIEHGNLVYMVTGNAEVIRHDGTTLQNLLEGIAHDYFSRALNWEYPSRIFFYRDDALGQMVLCYPTGDQDRCNEAISIEIASINRSDQGPCVGIRDLPSIKSAATGITNVVPTDWDSDPQAWDLDNTLWNEQASGYRPAHVVFGGGDQGMLETMASDDTWGNGAAVPIAAFAERTGLDMGDYDRRKTLTQAFPRMTGQPGQVLYFRWGAQEWVDAPVEWGDELEYRIGEDDRLDFFQDGRLIAHSVRSDGGGVWKGNGIRALARGSGRW